MTLLDSIILLNNKRGQVKPYLLLKEALNLISQNFPEIKSLAFGWRDDNITDYSRNALELKEINNSSVKYNTREEFFAMLVEANLEERRFNEIFKILNSYPQFREMVYDISQKEAKIRFSMKKSK